MGAAKRRRTRRIRRQSKAAVKHGRRAKPRHMLRGGRTGKVFSVYLKSRKIKRPAVL